jgi:chaperonin GroES
VPPPEAVPTRLAAAAVASVVVGSDDGRLPIRMLHDRVLVRIPQDDGERRSSGGIVIPSTAQVATRLLWAEALAVGNHVRVVEIGDRVLYNPEDRHEVEVHGETYLILRERDIHAVAAHRIEPSTGLYL